MNVHKANLESKTMDAKKDSFQLQNQGVGNFERGPRIATRTFVFYCTTSTTSVGKIAKAFGTQYLAVKVGTTTHFEGVNFPIPRCTLITVLGPCAIKVIDRDVTCSFMITETGLEASMNRWAKYKFETVETSSRFCKINIGGKMIEESIRVGKATGLVMPYTEEDMMQQEEMDDLPGVEFINLDSDQVQEQREKLKIGREITRDMIGSALRECGASRSEGRLFGLRSDVTAKLQPVKRVTNRVQGRLEEKPKAPRTPKGPFQLSRQSSEPEAMDASQVARLMREKLVIDTSSSFEDRTESTFLAEKIRERQLLSPVASPSVAAEVELSRKKIDSAGSNSPMSAPPFKLNDTYFELANAIASDSSLPTELLPLDRADPVKLGAFEKLATTFSFSKVGKLPIFNISAHGCEYSYAGYEEVTKAALVISGGNLVVLPVY
uniref:Non-structural protein NS2 n=1 Tax=Yunnan orbivirus TaxID=306276 RepID=A0A650F4W4_9REOV|nr:NS2 [Yunnan orbivirus]